MMVADAEIGKPGELLLVHGNAAGDVGEIFAEGDLHQKLFHLAQTVFGLQAVGIGAEAPQGLGIGGEPGKAVHHVLLALDEGPRQLPAGVDRFPDGGTGLIVERIDGGDGGAGERGEITQKDGGLIGVDGRFHGNSLTRIC